MPATGTISQGAIKIVLAGYEAVKTQLNSLAAQAKKLNEPFNTIGAASSKSFAVATGGILGFLKAADPVRFTVFTQKLEILSIHIGRIFIPLLQDAIGVVDQLISYFANLTDTQREQILEWTKLGLLITGAVTAFFAVYTAVSKVIPVIQALGVALKVLMSSTGVGLILVFAGIAFAIYEVLKATGRLDPIIAQLTAVFNKLTSAGLEPVMKVFEKVVGVVMVAVDKLMPLFEQFAALVGEVFGQLADEFGKLLAEALPIFMELATAGMAFAMEIGKALLSLLPAVMQIVGVLFKLWMVYQAMMAKVFLAILGAVVAVLPALVEIANVMTEVVSQLAPVLSEFAAVAGEVMGVIAELGAEIMKLVGTALADLIKSLAELFTMFWRAFGPSIIGAIRSVVDFARTCLAIIKDIVKAARELADTVSSLNPAGRQRVTERTVRSGAGDFSSGSASASGPEDFGGGGSAAAAPPTWMRDVVSAVGRAAGTAVGAAGRGGAANASRFGAMAPVQKVESYGIEEAFKRAQQGAAFDPSKMAEQERRRLMEDQAGSLRHIDQNTRRQAPATQV